MEESRRRCGMVSRPPHQSDDGARPSTAPPPPPSGAREPTPPTGTPMKTSSFSFIYISPYYVKTIYISMKSI
jgi:hypothetical protein